MRILVVDDELNIRKTLRIALEADGHRVAAVAGGRDALDEVGRHAYDVVFLDLRLNDENGMDLIGPLRERAPWVKVVVLTAYASVETAVEAMRQGAADYVPKPFSPPQIRLALERVREVKGLEDRVEALESALAAADPELDLTSASAAFREAVETVRRAAPTDAVILLRGESGTGKSVLARAAHGWSPRAGRPLGVVSCPTLSAELLESALFGHARGAFTGAVRDQPGKVTVCEGGTLFLDEIGDLPPGIQSKLLRFLQDREFERVGDPVTRRADVRILAATNVDLEQAVSDGRFRPDLYYRLNVIQITLPPLRERLEDLGPLAERMLTFLGGKYHKPGLVLEPAAVEVLRSYPWPGNLRELRNVLERAAILARGDRVGSDLLPEPMRTAPPAIRLGDPVSLREVEEAHIRRVLAEVPAVQEAARILGIDQATLWRRRKTYGI